MPRKNRPPILNPSETIMLAIDKLFEQILTSDESVFPLKSTLTAEQRAYIHEQARGLGLKSISKGKGDKRCLTIYKREGSTIVRKGAVLRLTGQSRRVLGILANRYALSPTERDRNQSINLVRDVKLGKSFNSRPMQIPPAGRPTLDMDQWRKSLPVYRKREEILHTIAANPVCIIQGDTGCGKTTQVPQYILEQCREERAGCRIIVTEPRRLACTSVCERVCAERNESPGSTVGYQIRLDCKVSQDTVLTFCTPGIVISAMLNEASMANVSHVIVDEVHERDRFCDFLLICLRDLRVRFPQLRVVLMSAKANTQMFEKYFTCPVITVPGRSFAVREHYLLDALKLTGYCTPKMIECQQRLREERLMGDSVQGAGQGAATMEAVLEDPGIKEMDDCIENAFLRGGEDLLKQLLQRTLSSNYPTDFQHSTTGITALMVAAKHNQVLMIHTLVMYGADATLRTEDGSTALDLARRNGAAFAVAYLEDLKERVAVPDEVSQTPEQQKLLDFNCSVVTVPGRSSRVPKHYLLDAQKLTGYCTPKMIECQQRLRKERLMGAGQGAATMEAVLEDAAIKEMDDCLLRAFIHGGEDLLKQLLQRTIDSSYSIDFQHSTMGITALMVAAKHNQVKMINTLVMYGADASLQRKNGRMALDLARRCGAADAVAYLEDLKEREAVRDEVSLTSEQQRLLNFTCSVNTENWTGYCTPKMIECQQRLRKERLMGAGQGAATMEAVLGDAAIKEMDDCIEYAFIFGGEDILRQLLRRALSSCPTDFQHSTKGITALMVAAKHNQVQMIDTLVMHGAKATLQMKDGRTALDLARRNGAAFAVAYLESLQEMEAVPDEVPLSSGEQILLDSYLKTHDDRYIDYGLIVKLIFCLLRTTGSGGILVFLPGCDDIIRVRNRFQTEESQVAVADRFNYRLYLLHSQIHDDSKAVFRPAPGCARKIILATNIAETSITIDDVVYVIDTGKVKLKSLDLLSGSSQLDVDWISKACAQQRRGRAGRCQDGFCYRLYSKERYKSFERYTMPEILRTPLADLCLQAKLFAKNNYTIAEFLGKAVEPPTQRAVREAVQLLKTIDALNACEDLTPLGICLLNLSTDPRYGKMLLYAVMLKCLDPVLTIVASMDYRDPFIIPTFPDDRRRAKMVRKKLAEGTKSDHFVLLRLYEGWQQAVANRIDRAYSENHFISPSTMEVIHSTRTQLLGQLRALGLVREQPREMRDLNTNSNSWAVVKAAVCAGLYPNLARVHRKQSVLRTRKEFKVSFHVSSVLRSGDVTGLATDWVLYTELVKVGSSCQFRTCTLVTPLIAALVCCPAQASPDLQHDDDAVSDSEVEEDPPNTLTSLAVDEWMELQGSLEDVDHMTFARHKLQAVFLRRLAACVTPSKATSTSTSTEAEDAFIKGIVTVIAAEENAASLVQPVGSLVDAVQAMQINHNIQNPRNRNWQPLHQRADEGDRLEGAQGPTRYFVIRSFRMKALQLAFARSTMHFSKKIGKKLNKARKGGGEVVLIFATFPTLHGVAKLGLGQLQKRRKWPLHWIQKHAVSFDGNLPLPEELRGVFFRRNGVEIPEYVERGVMRLWERSLMGPRPYHDDFNGRGMRPFGFMGNM